MTDYVVAGLTKRRAELAGEAERLRTSLADVERDLFHLDAVILQLDPGFTVSGIKPKRSRATVCTARGEASRFVLGALRGSAEPMTTAAIRAQWMARMKMDAQSRDMVRLATRVIGKALARQKRRGVVQGEPGLGRLVVWELVR